MGTWIQHFITVIPYVGIFLAFVVFVPDIDHIWHRCDPLKQRCEIADSKTLFLHNPKLILLVFFAALGWLIHLLVDFTYNGFIYGGV